MAYIPKLTKQNIMKDVDFRKSMEYLKAIKALHLNKFNEMKTNLINSFEGHLVTKEIDGGVGASNISGTLGGKGNLFSFIGFKSNSNPTEPIRLALNAISQTAVITKKDGSATSHILYPSPDDIFKITPLPWADGRSWVLGIERGISNFGQYLDLKAESSRSGRGIQNENVDSGASFSTTPYITELIKTFEKEVNKLNSSRIT